MNCSKHIPSLIALKRPYLVKFYGILFSLDNNTSALIQRQLCHVHLMPKIVYVFRHIFLFFYLIMYLNF